MPKPCSICLGKLFSDDLFTIRGRLKNKERTQNNTLTNSGI
ncbi:hypothetical protein HMPREF1051_0632 [Neisseria sicca VK64]|uniref:Uncharacterized protein n=1 Tax=Neisseria sicca VK64 TaxID=1095748 RepID=I2NLZ0_NEISI|nr:hypothetical protein HMPREF1051_0632 [Neisseria sicca VK64]